MAPALPPFAPFPAAAWRALTPPDEWAACLDAWVALAEAHLSLSDADFAQVSAKDESVPEFLITFARETAAPGPSAVLGGSSSAETLLKACFMLASRLLRSSASPQNGGNGSLLLRWDFLSDLCRVYGKKRVGTLLAALPKASQQLLESSSLAGLKKFLIKNLDAGIQDGGDVKGVEERLERVNFLLSASPAAAAFFLAGSDFVDGLISCFKIMNPPLRKAIITTAYLCLIGLTEGESPKYAMLTDQLYSLKAAADAHKAGPLNASDSMVAELVTATPILQQIQHRLEAAGSSTGRAKSVVQELGAFRRPGGMMKPKRLVRRRVDKGKGVAVDQDYHEDEAQQIHVHRMSQITQIQDLFPDLGSGFVSKLLDEYGDDTEQVVAHLLEDTLPAHLKEANRSEELSETIAHRKHVDLAPRSTPPLPPTRHNVFDDDELDRLAVDTSKLHFGKRGADKTADDVLRDRSTAPNKAAILSALAAFDADDDERDDTYDAEDVGGAVDTAAAGEDAQEANEEVLFRAYQADPKHFDRDAATRRGQHRLRLREETGMTDEAIEGWALMLSRNPQQRRRLEAKFTTFTGAQTELASTAWRASPGGSGAEDSGTDGAGGGTSSRGGGRGRGRGGRGGGGGGRGGRGGGGNVAGPTGDKDTEQARRRKEANKGSRANHNRRDQRARKMARGGFPG